MSKYYYAVRCYSCGELVIEDCDPPSFDASADSAEDMMGVEQIRDECHACGTEIGITVRAVTYDVFEATSDDGGFVYFGHPFMIDDEEQFEAYLEDSAPDDPYRFFVRSTNGLHVLRDVKTDNPRIEQAQYRMIYANQFSILEAYLCDRLVSLVTRSRANLVEFACRHSKLKDQSIKLKAALDNPNYAELFVLDYLKSVLYYKLAVVAEMYRDAFGIDILPDERVHNALRAAIDIRHDIVHRNGTRKDGTVRTLEPIEVDSISRLVSGVVGSIERSLERPIREMEFYRAERGE